MTLRKVLFEQVTIVVDTRELTDEGIASSIAHERKGIDQRVNTRPQLDFGERLSTGSVVLNEKRGDFVAVVEFQPRARESATVKLLSGAQPLWSRGVSDCQANRSLEAKEGSRVTARRTPVGRHWT